MYIPKNRIKTNLHTNGGEYVVKSTLRSYTGYYHKLYNGTFFTGKTPNEQGIVELIPPPPIPEPSVTLTNFNRKIPQQYYPSSTEDDYTIGMFIRYFLVKTNEPLFIEVDKKTYDKIKSKNKQWVWELYVPFEMPWTLIGNMKEVFLTNKNIVSLAEKRIKRTGLGRFLKQNYLKYFKYTGDLSKRTYPEDDSLIPIDLPREYGLTQSPPKKCQNCFFNESNHCNLWKADIKSGYWCDDWKAVQEGISQGVNVNKSAEKILKLKPSKVTKLKKDKLISSPSLTSPTISTPSSPSTIITPSSPGGIGGGGY